MGWTLLQAKYQAPAARALVARPRLAALMERAWAYPLTLIAAPAGAGKSALAAGWAAAARGGGAAARAVAWLTLDAADSDPARFSRYLRAAVAAAAPAVGAALAAAAPPPYAPPLDQLPDLLLNALAAHRGELALVLEDYHLIDGAAVHRAVARIVDYLPPHAHLLITARRDPPLPLARWRAGGRLHAIGLADLRFSEAEAGDLLAQVVGLRLPAETVAALAARTEGWAAGLQLAGLALREQPDPAGLIGAFHGAQRYVAAYLLDELLAQQPPAVSELLLKTAVLERLCPDLCDAVLGGPPAPPAAALLAQIARDGLLLTPLDEQGRWYRLHPLFREFLEREGERAGLDRGPLHRCAAGWFARHGLVEEAFEHALAGGAPELAAEALAGEVAALIGRHELPTLGRLLGRLPPACIWGQPRLCCAQIWLLLDAGRPAAAGPYLEHLAGGAPAEMGVELTALHALHAAMTGEVARAAALARAAEGLQPADDPLARALIAFGLGAAYKMGSQGGRAEHCLRESAAAALAAENRYLASEAYGNLGDLLADLGRLPEAEQALRQALALARAPSGAEPPAAGWLRWDLGRIAYEWDDLAAAREEAAAAAALCERWGNAAIWTRSLLLAAQVAQAGGDLAGAAALIDRAEPVAQLAEEERLRHLVLRRRLALALAAGQLEPARHLAELLDERAASPAPAAHEIALARWCLAAGRPGDALARLRRAMGRLDETNLVSARIQAHTLAALALQAQGQGAAAREALDQALGLARPGRFRRSFLDEGEPLRELLRRSAEGSAHAAYIGELLAAFPPPGPAAPPYEPPTGRELQVLRLLAAGCSNRRIAEQLVIAESTVKRHVSNLYLKLGVQSRTQAVARAGELGLI